MTSLYRKYRPQTFDELVGQEHVTTALRNALSEDRVAHAYLFSGPRGTGKTTTARILARELGCDELDVIEQDAASKRKVEEMRELLERVAYRSAGGGKKVYVLDEAHMLTEAATNTLLKTLEEPPDHVVFVLATTEPEKVLPTIRSRTQHYAFRLLTTQELTDHLADLCEREGVEADRAALELIARRGAGSARDAVSFLDQALAHGAGKIDLDAVTELIGATPFDRRVAVLDAVAADDAAGVLVAVSDSLSAGTEARQVAEDLVRTLRDAFLVTVVGDEAPVDVPPEERERLAVIGDAFGHARLVRALESLGQAVVDMRGAAAPDPRLVLEVALVRLARREAGPPIDALSERVERLETALERGATGGGTSSPGTGDAASESAPPTAKGRAPRQALGAVQPPPSESVEARPEEPTVPDVPEPAPVAPAEPADDALELDDLVLAWSDTLAALESRLRRAVQDAQPIRVRDGVAVFGVPPARFDAINQRFREGAARIREELSKRLPRAPRFKLEPHEAFSGRPPEPLTRPTNVSGEDVDSAPSDAREEPPEDETVDLAELAEAPADAPVDSVTHLVEAFDATVVEEQPRNRS